MFNSSLNDISTKISFVLYFSIKLFTTFFPTQNSLDVEFFNPNIAGEKAQLMQKNQSQYVPLLNGSVAATIPFHDDQLFEERSRNMQWTFRDGETTKERLEGLEPEHADWHAKFIMYKVKIYYCVFKSTCSTTHMSSHLFHM